MSGHGGSTNRTFIVEDYADECGQWAADEATGEQGIDDERSSFWTWDDNELGSPESFRFAKLQEEKAKEKAKAKVDSKELGRAYLGEEQTQDTEWWSEEDSVWWSKGKKARKALRKVKKLPL